MTGMGCDFKGLHWQVGKPEKEGIPVAWHKALKEVWPALFTGLSLQNKLLKRPEMRDVQFISLGWACCVFFFCFTQKKETNTYALATRGLPLESTS